MKWFQRVAEQVAVTARILTVWDCQKGFSSADRFKLSIVFMMSALNAIAKIGAPAAFAKGVEMIVLGEEERNYSGLAVNAAHLFYLSVVLSAYIKSEIYFKKLLIRNAEKHLTEHNLSVVISCSHQLSMQDHLHNKPALTKVMLEVLSHQARLLPEVATVIWQALFDITLGTVIIYLHYGNVIGTEFLLYCILDILLISHLIAFIAKQSQRFEEMDSELFKLMNHEYEIINHEETVRMFNQVDHEVAVSKKHALNYLSANKAYQASQDLSSLVKVLPMVIANLIPISLYLKSTSSLADIDELFFLVSYINLFGSNIINLSQSLKVCSQGIKSIDHVKELEELVKTQTATNNSLVPIYHLPIRDQPPEISFENVIFCYPNRREPTLKGVSFTIPPGQKIGIIGRSNTGKSTIIKLLFKFYRPTSGLIKLNGHNLESIPVSILTKLFCCVPQAGNLFESQSIKYNVLYGASDQDLFAAYVAEAKTKAAANINQSNNYQSVNAHSEDLEAINSIESQEASRLFSTAMNLAGAGELSHNYQECKRDTQTLSGGQRQRVSLARALVRNSNVFIFDETTSALDSFTEMAVLKNIKKSSEGRTTIMITHRLSTIQDADNVLVLEGGQVVESGKPKQLLERNGIYASYWQAQMKM